MVSFECDNNKMLAKLNNLGNLLNKLVEKVSGIDYKSKKQPLVSVCEKGKEINQLYKPRGVTVDNKTGNIYVSDVQDHCVELFDSTGKYFFKFGGSEGEGKMISPIGVAICGDRILISQGNHCILNYQLNGKFISKIGEYGNGELEIICPYGLTIDESKSRKWLVLNVTEELGRFGKLVQKVVSIDYNSKLKPLLSMCEIGNEKEQLCNSDGSCVDSTNGNIYVADHLNNCIKAFSSCGEFLFKFGDTDDEGKMSCLGGLLFGEIVLS